MSENENSKTDWLRASALGFGYVSETDEFIHTDVGSTAFSATETWWFEAIEPKAGLIASFYIAMRPNLGMCSAGAWIWKGVVRDAVLADHLNYQIYLPKPEFDGSRLSAPQVGLAFDLIDPLRETHIYYDPPGFDCSAKIVAKALMPPAVRSNGKHFEQSLWMTGEIRLNGETYVIDGPSFRDRSWGEARPEDHIAHPPIGWLCGVCDDGRISFNLSGCDDPSTDPSWVGKYDVDSKKAFYDGWIVVDGALRRVISMSKRTTRLPEERLRPVAIEVDFVDDRGDRHYLVGRPKSAYWMQHWPNIFAWFGFTEWELDGIYGYGEAQDYAWPDYAKRFWR